LHLTDFEYDRGPHRTGKNQNIQESICGFLLDEVINPNWEFYADSRISVGRLDPNKDVSDEENN